MTTQHLREYQSTAIRQALDALAEHGSSVLQMPTGAGKTRAATEIVSKATGGVWFICHRREIIKQAASAFTKAGIDFGIISPKHEFEPSKSVQIVSIDTVINRMDLLPHPALVIWDECHHVAAPRWAKVRSTLAGAQHLGLTATPERLDGKGLKEWFAHLVVGPSIGSLIGQGHLSDFRYFAPSEPDLKSAKLNKKGEYTDAAIDRLMNTPVLIGDAVREYKERIDGKRAIVFAASVSASLAIVERFNAEGVPASHVDGTTPDDERVQAVEDLAAGRIKVLSNVGVFTEGFDLPAIDAVILMRPTRSVGLFLQMIGRGLRWVDGKTAYIFDHAGLHYDHNDPRAEWEWSLDGEARRRRVDEIRSGGVTNRTCPKCKEVRFERVSVCRCGYEFPTGREIGEYDGKLYELRGEVPDGCVTQSEFARIIKKSKSFVSEHVRSGDILTYGIFVHLEKGLSWYDNKYSIAPGTETTAEFSRRCGVYISTPRKWIDRGIPTNESGMIIVSDALEWIDKQKSLLTVSEFASKHHVDSRVVSRWILLGMPIGEKGKIPSNDADEWVVVHRVGRDVSEKIVQFARRVGGTDSFAYTLVRAGVPQNIEGMVVINEAISWFDNIYVPLMGSKAIPNRFHGYEDKSKFASRIGVANSYPYRKNGLPTHPDNGWVHIQRGLEWVRDNTNIAIPPSAWPQANDNGEPNQQAA